MNDRPTDQPALKTLDLFVCRTERECWLQRPAEDGCVWFVMQGAPPGHTAFIFQLRPTSWFFFFFLSLSYSVSRKAFRVVSSPSLSECVWVRESDCFLHTPSHKPHSHTVGVCLFSGGGLHFERWCPELCVSVCVCVCVFHINIKLSQGHALAVSTV